MKTLSEIKSALSEKRAPLLKKYPIKTLAIFGSFARNEQDENSDLDLMVEFNEKVGSEFIQLADELEDFLGFKVDLVSKKAVKEKYFAQIKDELIYV
jgi:predicted nucleotidyltransferase